MRPGTAAPRGIARVGDYFVSVDISGDVYDKDKSKSRFLSEQVVYTAITDLINALPRSSA
ncbi:hypothetical protein ACIBI9_63615 [Nonomuraea sp. NPDC050451]|uniref:hypothetical protein n=2 Tax=Nonomuraea sp. NPDC050451 TaxID=3364364 RepID=UPI0037A824F5